MSFHHSSYLLLESLEAINPAIMNTLITSMLRLRALLREASGEDYVAARDHSAATVGLVTALSKAASSREALGIQIL